MLSCKGVCTRDFTTKKVCRGDKGDFKRCSRCEVYIEWLGTYCPCCGVRLKHSPRNNIARKNYREQQSIKNIDFDSKGF